MTSTSADLATLVGPALASALAARGYDTLTAVQQAVLDEGCRGRDLRITSQTGSGKTIAIGFVLRDLVAERPMTPGPVARPAAIVLAPARELAKQVAEELTWLYAPLGVRVASITGGANFLEVKRALGSGPGVVVGTPGRLRDALERGRIDTSALGAVVLDEADSMLDLGFREELDAILALLPDERRSHLVSATFSRDVVALADRFQKEPVHVQGTRLGEANLDIEHVVHLVTPDQRVDALVNLLLADEEAKSLVFARTRADVARIAGELSEAGFVVRMLSGEMEQPERDRALAAFRDGGVQVLVATDVAARGLDVPDVARVIQVEPPANVETYTHRSGRTGRAGKQGTSLLFVSPAHYPAIARGLSRARISHKVEPIPRPEEIRRAQEERLVAWLEREVEGERLEPLAVRIAERVLAGASPATAVARLVVKAGLHGQTAPRLVRNIEAPAPAADRSAHRPPRPERPVVAQDAWVPFLVTWGGRHGADARRLLALACRRGKITGQEIGAIRVEATYSFVSVAPQVADSFAVEAAKPDPRDPRVRIERASEERPRRAPMTAPPPPPARAERREMPREAPRAAPRVVHAKREKHEDGPPRARPEGGHAPPRRH